MSGSFTDKFKKKSFLDKAKEAKKDDLNEKPLTEKPLEAKEKESDGSFSKDKKSFMDHLISSRGDLCFKIVGRDITGEIAWYYVLVDKDKKDSFLKHKPGDSYNIEDYGKIIVSGYGEEVPEDIQEMLKEKYGFDNF